MAAIVVVTIDGAFDQPAMTPAVRERRRRRHQLGLRAAEYLVPSSGASARRGSAARRGTAAPETGTRTLTAFLVPSSPAVADGTSPQVPAGPQGDGEATRSAPAAAVATDLGRTADSPSPSGWDAEHTAVVAVAARESATGAGHEPPGEATPPQEALPATIVTAPSPRPSDDPRSDRAPTEGDEDRTDVVPVSDHARTDADAGARARAEATPDQRPPRRPLPAPAGKRAQRRRRRRALRPLRGAVSLVMVVVGLGAMLALTLATVGAVVALGLRAAVGS